MNGLGHIFNVNDMSLHTKRWELGLGLDFELDLSVRVRARVIEQSQVGNN